LSLAAALCRIGCAARAPTRESQTLSRPSHPSYSPEMRRAAKINISKALALSTWLLRCCCCCCDAYSECGIGAKASAVRRSIFLKSAADLFALGTRSASRKVVEEKMPRRAPPFLHM